jgi:hypothetical protein
MPSSHSAEKRDVSCPSKQRRVPRPPAPSGGRIRFRHRNKPAWATAARLYVPSTNEATHPRCCDEGYPDGPGRASNKEGESWVIILRSFVGIDTSKSRNAIAIADGGRVANEDRWKKQKGIRLAQFSDRF